MAANASSHNEKPLHLAIFTWSNWDCCICCDRQESGRPWLTRESDSVCEDCVCNLFNKALQHDIHYPAKWGPEELDPDDFQSILGRNFTDNYKETGRRIAEENRLLEPVLIPGLERGEDYQLCPTCHRPICLEDGCNHLVCPCGTNFCLICGREALDNGSGHWDAGRCPRYNTFGSGNEQYDLAHDGDDDDYDDDDEPEVVLDATPVNNEEENAFDRTESYIDNDQFSRLQEASYDFNVAMQTASPTHANILSALLTAPLLLNTPEYRWGILTVMSAFQPEYHDEDTWMNGFQRRTALHTDFINHIVALPPRPRDHALQTYVFHDGPAEALRRPVGGFFRMDTLAQRLAACAWLSERVSGPRTEDQQMRFAWFDTQREHGAWVDNLYNSLQDKVFLLPTHTIIFEFFHSGFLVEVRKREEAAPAGDVLRVHGVLAALCAFLVDPGRFITPRDLPGLRERRETGDNQA